VINIPCPFCTNNDLQVCFHETPVLHCCEKKLPAYPLEYGGGLDPQTIAELFGLDNFALCDFEGVELIARRGLVDIYELDMDAYDVKREPLSSLLDYNPVIISSYGATVKMRRTLDSHKPSLPNSTSKIVISLNGERQIRAPQNYNIIPEKIDFQNEDEILHHLRKVVGVVGSRCQIEHLFLMIYNLNYRRLATRLAGSLAYDLHNRKVSLLFLNRGAM